MANTTEEIYVKLKVDNSQFNSSLTGMKREIASLKGLIGSNLITDAENTRLKARFGELKDEFSKLQNEAVATNTGMDETFGNLSRLGGVAAQSVAGITGAMSLLGIESAKAGEVEKKILQYMAVGNALQAVADSKRLVLMVQIYAQQLTNFLGIKMFNTEIDKQNKLLEVQKTTTEGVVGAQAAQNITTEAAVATTAKQAVEVENLSTVENKRINTTNASIQATNAEIAAYNAKATAIDNLNKVQSQIAFKKEQGKPVTSGLIEKERLAQEQLTVATEQHNQSVIRKTQVQKLQAISTVIDTTATEANTIATEANTVATNTDTVAKEKQTLATRLATLAKKAFDAAMSLGPMLVLIAAIAALVAAWKGVQWIIEKSRESSEKAIDSWIRSVRILGNLKKAYQDSIAEQKKYADELYDTELQLQVLRGDITQKEADRMKNAREGNKNLIDISLRYAKALMEQKAALTELQELQRRGVVGKQTDVAAQRVIEATKLVNIQKEEIDNNAKIIKNKNEIITLTESQTKAEDENKKALEAQARAQEEFADALFKMGLDENFDPLKKTMDRLKSKPAQIPIKLGPIIPEIDVFFNTIQNKIKTNKELTLINMDTKGLDAYQEGINTLLKLREDVKRGANIVPLDIDPKLWKEKITEMLKEIDAAMAEEKDKMLQMFQAATDAVAQFVPNSFKNTFIAFSDIMSKIQADIPIKATELIQAVGALANDLMAVIFGNMNQNIQDNLSAGLEAIQVQYDVADKKLQSLKDKKLISDAEYDKKKAANDKKKADAEKALKKKAFEDQQKLAIIQAVINTALGVTAALTMQPVGWVLAALVAAAGIAEVAIISSQKPPEFAKGGRVFASGGMLDGPSHTAGGIPIMAEGGEFIINKNVAQRPGMSDFLTKINSGQSPNTTIVTTQLDPSVLRGIVLEVVAGTQSIPVNVVETDISRVQRKVNTIETSSSW